MGQRSRTRVRGIVEDRPRGISPGAAALSLLAMGLGGMIVWNAFYGMHDGRQVSHKIAVVPPGASTHVVLEAPEKHTNTITITYSAHVEDVQRELSATGHFRGLVDGVMGKQTALAIKKYQADNGLATTGEPSKDLLDHIRYTRKVLAASEFTGSVSNVPGSVVPKKMKKAVAAASAKGFPIVREVQQRLSKLGYDIVVVTGEPDDQLRSAVLKFQMDHGLSMDGAVSKELLSALKVAEASSNASTQ